MSASHLALAALVFAVANAINFVYITVFYHRGLAHAAVALGPRTMRFVAVTGMWMTGLDPKGWACMHRLHHAKSDTADDPHNPVHHGILGTFMAQHRGYERVLGRLLRGDVETTRWVHDLDFPVNELNRRRLWWLPLVAWAVVSAAVAIPLGAPLLGLAWFVGLMSHPIYGWLVNSFGHARGGRNFDTRDDSRNNLWVALIAWGEGLQNNHHRFPGSARFAARWYEPDPGYRLCQLLDAVGVVRIRRATLLGPGHLARPGVVADDAAEGVAG